MADRSRTPGDLRCDTGAECAPTGCGNGLGQSDSCGGLDANWPSGDDRRSGSFGLSGRGSCQASYASSGMTSVADQLRLPSGSSGVDPAIARAAHGLLKSQQGDGHWVFELEADATIPAEYVLLRHYRGENRNTELEQKIAVYLRRIQGKHAGWPLYHDGDFDMSASVKAYFALKMIGDSPDAPHMRRAREAILARGGAVHSNVFTRVLLSLYGILDWRSVPEMPVEIMLLPRWFPFHLTKVSYWSRTVIAPLLVLMAKKPRARNPRGITVRELFAPGTHAKPPKARGSAWAVIFNAIDRVLRWAEPLMPRKTRQRAIAAAVAFVTERLNGEDGLGAIYPAMANTVMMLECLGYAKDHPHLVTAKQALAKLLVPTPGRSYC